MNLADLFVTLSADPRNLVAGLNVSKGAVSNFERSVDRSVGKTNAAFGLMAKGAGIAAAAAVATAGAVSRLTLQALEYGDAIDEASKRTGIAAERLQRLQGVAIANGSSAEGMTDALDVLNRKLGEAITKGGPAADEFARLGVAIRDEATGAARGLDPVLGDIANALKGASSEAEAARGASVLFGRALGPELVPLLRQGSEAINEQAAAMQGIMTDEQVRRAGELNDQIDLMARQIKGDLYGALVDLGPELVKTVAGFRDLTHWAVELFRVDDNELLGKLQRVNEKLTALEPVKDRGAWRDQYEKLLEEKAEVTMRINKRALERDLKDRMKAHQEEVRLREQTEAAKAEKEQVARERSLEEQQKFVEDMERIRFESEIALQDRLAEVRIRAKVEDGQRERAEARARLENEQDFERENAEWRADLEHDTRERRKEANERALDDMADYSNRFAEDVGAALSDAGKEGEDTAKRIKDAFLDMIKEILIQEAVIRPLQGALRGVIGNVTGTGPSATSSSATSSSGSSFGQQVGGQVLNGFGKQTGNWITNFFGGFFADGGDPPVGKASIVGEEGPEVIVPKMASTVIPNHTLRMGDAPETNLNVNVYTLPGQKADVRKGRNGSVDVFIREMEDAMADRVNRGGALQRSINGATGSKRPPIDGVL